MADIFISYARSDKALALKLAALLEANGYSTWWDAGIETGEPYRNRIMEELNRARATIVIWTPVSINSDWVRAEADRAKQQGKLIPARVGQLSNSEIPLPFGETQTLDIADEAAIISAIERELTKPREILSSTQLVIRRFRYDVLSWLGIVGGAITLSTNLMGVLKLAKLVRAFLSNWVEILRFLWQSVFLFQFKIAAYDALSLTITGVVAVNLIHSTLRKYKTRAPSRHPYVGLSVALLLIYALFALGFGKVDTGQHEKSLTELDRTTEELFKDDSSCVAFMKQYLRNIDNLGVTVPRKVYEAAPSDKEKAENCIRNAGIEADKLYIYAFGRIVFYDKEKDQSVIVKLVKAVPDNIPGVMFFALAIVSFPIWLPFAAYLVARQFIGLRMNVTVLVGRLTSLLIVVTLIIVFNFAMLFLEQFDWMKTINS